MASPEHLCPSCRVTRLSRYNPDPLCGPCLRAARSVGSVAPVWLWDSEPMRRALARADVGAVVAILRGAAGLSQLDLAHLVQGWSQSTVSLIERGRRDTLYDVRELLRFTDAVAMPREALLPLILGEESATLGVDDSSGEHVDRREFGVAAAGFMASAALPRVQVPDRADAGHVRYLRAAVARLWARDQAAGGGGVLRQALHALRQARRMLDEAEYAEKVGHDLLMVTADLGLLAGWLAYDCMQQSLARRLYEDALLLARDSGSCELQAHVLASMAMQSTFLARTHDSKGQARESVRLADQASDAAWHEPSHRLRALVALRQAAAHAELGDTVGFRRGIGRARAELDRGPHPADVPWTEFVTPSEVTGHEAMGYVRLGQPARAAALYEDVLEDPELGPRNRICYQALRVRAILDTGDAREAIAGGLRLLPALTGGSMSTARPLTQLDVVRSAAERTGEEEFCARYDSAARALAN